jgi:hypothetical protein
MQLLLGMLDAALSRVQDRRAASERRAVALKVDEAPLAINAAFAQTLALKRSAGLETLACWQTDAQWEPELRDQLDALFAHRVLFATASAADARSVSALLMSEFSDQIRGGDEQLARLFSPDVRLHLPRHTALASWTTPGGRERPFIATTIPLSLDRDRIEWHTRAQAARGGCELRDPAPPPDLFARPQAPWLRQSPRAAARSCATAAMQPGATAATQAGASGAAQPGATAAVQPGATAATQAGASWAVQPGATAAMQAGVTAGVTAAMQAGVTAAMQSGVTAAPQSEAPPASYRELLALDGAARMRLLPVAAPARGGRIAPGDRELLVWLAGARIALSSQIHRRLHPQSSLTVTQRQLKRLADAGLLARFQLHRDDGGGIPLCVAATQAAIDLLGLEGRRAPELREDALPALRSDMHTVGWLLALEARAGDALVEVLGPGRAAIVPGSRERSGLDVGNTLRPRDFLVSARDGSRTPAERFAAVRPSAVASLRTAAALAEHCDLLVVADAGDPPAWLEAYDHLLAGWWRSVERYRRAGRPPAVVVVCPTSARALALVGAADALLSSTLAQIGVDPSAWERSGRAGIHFATEEDLHHGLLHAWRVPLVPPSLRGDAAWEPLRVPFAQLPPEPSQGAAKPPWR